MLREALRPQAQLQSLVPSCSVCRRDHESPGRELPHAGFTEFSPRVHAAAGAVQRELLRIPT